MPDDPFYQRPVTVLANKAKADMDAETAGLELEVAGGREYPGVHDFLSYLQYCNLKHSESHMYRMRSQSPYYSALMSACPPPHRSTPARAAR